MILVLALGFRLYGVGFGLPEIYHADEPIVVNHALAYGTGDLNPHFFIIPPLTSYILFFLYVAYYSFLNFFNVINGTEEFAASFLKDPTVFYIIGRVMVGSIPSLLSICFTYKLSSMFFSRKASLYACLIMSVAFLNVINAHYIYTDNLLVMFMLLAYVVMATLIEKPSRGWYILSAICIGVAIATKYNMTVLVGPFLLAHLYVKTGNIKTVIDLNLLLCAIVTVLTFIICNPYSILDGKFFLSTVLGMRSHGGGFTGWSYHIFYSVFEGIGSFVTILGIVGLFVALKGQPKRMVFFIAFPVLFYLHLVVKAQVHPRYALALIPFLSIGAGFLLFDYIFTQFKSRITHFFIFIAALLALIPTISKSIKGDILFASQDTRSCATEWIKENLPISAKIALDSTFFGPQLTQTVAQFKEKQTIINKQPELKQLKKRKLDLQIKAVKDEKTYEVYYLVTGNEDSGQFLKFWPVIDNNIDELKRNGIQYVVFNNMTMTKDMKRFHEEIDELFDPVAQFSPYKDERFRDPYDDIEVTCMPIKAKELTMRQRTGPCITIYRLK